MFLRLTEKDGAAKEDPAVHSQAEQMSFSKEIAEVCTHFAAGKPIRVACKLALMTALEKDQIPDRGEVPISHTEQDFISCKGEKLMLLPKDLLVHSWPDKLSMSKEIAEVCAHIAARKRIV